MATDDVSALADRPHWTVLDRRAEFEPVSGGWRGTVSRLRGASGRGGYHVAIIDRTGAIRYTSEAGTVDEAARSAERGVLARNALRLLRRA